MEDSFDPTFLTTNVDMTLTLTSSYNILGVRMVVITIETSKRKNSLCSWLDRRTSPLPPPHTILKVMILIVMLAIIIMTIIITIIIVIITVTLKAATIIIVIMGVVPYRQSKSSSTINRTITMIVISHRKWERWKKKVTVDVTIYQHHHHYRYLLFDVTEQVKRNNSKEI